VMGDPDFAAVARAWGGAGVTVRVPEDFNEVRHAVADRRGLLVIDVKVREDEEHRALQPGAFFPESAL
jgi:thiamine pyrophosphate-dependent acetolactate synthase large subunit-like protein